MQRCGWMMGVFAFMLVGCSSARLVDSTIDGGCVAVSDNTDSWPSYNLTKAHDLIKKQCPNGYQVIRETEVVVGQTTTHNKEHNTKEVPIMAGLAVDVQQTTKNTTSVRDQTEWRIWYQKN